MSDSTTGSQDTNDTSSTNADTAASNDAATQQASSDTAASPALKLQEAQPTAEEAAAKITADAEAATAAANVAKGLNADGSEKTAEQKATETENIAKGLNPDGTAKANPDAKAPEKYELKTPDGITADAEIVAKFEDIAKGLDLSQEDAQKLYDLGPALIKTIQAKQTEAMVAAQTAWTAASKADKEFGGEALDANLGTAKKALDQFGTPELKTLLKESGLGNHPELIRAFVRVGKAMSEDGVVTGRQAAQSSTSLEDRLYGGTKVKPK